MPRALRRLIVFLLLSLLGPSLAWAQPKAGVVTTLEGNVTATRAAAPPVPLKFKDDVLLQDKITTAEQSLARMLLGGKAVVTVRETRAAVGAPRTLGVLERFNVVGLSTPVVTPIRPEQLGAIRAGLQPKSQPHTGAGQDQVKGQSVSTATALATSLSSPAGTTLVGPTQTTPPPTTVANTTNTVAPIIPPVVEAKTSLEAGASTGVASKTLTNGGFETGSFSGWTLDGAGSVISSFGTLSPPEGGFMALIHTKTGSTLSGCASGKDCTKSTLSQTFNATSIVTIKGKGALLSNEFPTFTSTKSSFNDRYLVQVVDAAGQTFTIFDQGVNETTDFTATSAAVTVGTFTLSKGAGATGFDERKKTFVPAKGDADPQALREQRLRHR